MHIIGRKDEAQHTKASSFMAVFQETPAFILALSLVFVYPQGTEEGNSAAGSAVSLTLLFFALLLVAFV